MRSIVVGLLVLVLGLVACGGGKAEKAEKADKAAVETYINADLNSVIGMLWVGKKPLDTVEADHFDSAHGWFAHPSALDTTVIPRMEQVLAGAAKITVPGTMKNLHAQLVSVATTYRDAAKELGDAVEANDGRSRYQAWQQSMDAVLADYHITLNDPPPPAPLPK